MFGRGAGSKRQRQDRRRRAGSFVRFGWKHGSLDQRRCAVAMHKFRFWLRAHPLLASERDRSLILADMRAASREFPGCVPDRYWRLAEQRIRALPIEKRDWNDEWGW
jgi:hypothetical protein